LDWKASQMALMPLMPLDKMTFDEYHRSTEERIKQNFVLSESTQKSKRSRKVNRMPKK
jgi:hypothetical protein